MLILCQHQHDYYDIVKFQLTSRNNAFHLPNLHNYRDLDFKHFRDQSMTLMKLLLNNFITGPNQFYQ